MLYLGQDAYGEMKEKPVLHVTSSTSVLASQFEVSTVAPILPEPIMVFSATDSQNGEQLNNDEKAKQNEQIQQKDQSEQESPMIVPAKNTTHQDRVSGTLSILPPLRPVVLP